QTLANAVLVVMTATFLTVTYPWLRLGGHLEAPTFGLLLGTLVARAICWLYWRRIDLRLRWTALKPEMRPVFRRLVGKMGVGYLIYGLTYLTLQSDTIIVGALGGPLMAGEFTVLWKPADVAVQTLSRISDFLMPYIIHMDARGDRDGLLRTFRTTSRIVLISSLAVAAAYAIGGPALTRLWVGASMVPHQRYAYVLAGAVVFWLSIARLPAVFAYSTVRLRRLNIIALIEVGAKIGLIVALFRRTGPL